MSKKAKTPKAAPLTNVSMATLRILKKIVEDACKAKGRREELGQGAAEFSVRETLILDVEGTVKVESSCPDAIIAQKCEPFKLLAAAMELANTQLEAAGVAGIDLAQVVENAEKLDPKVAERAEKTAKAELAKIKEEARGFRWGRVLINGTVTRDQPLFVRPPANDEDSEAA